VHGHDACDRLHGRDQSLAQELLGRAPEGIDAVEGDAGPFGLPPIALVGQDAGRIAQRGLEPEPGPGQRLAKGGEPGALLVHEIK
jgi:hypothetical protein